MCMFQIYDNSYIFWMNMDIICGNWLQEKSDKPTNTDINSV